MPDQEPDQTEVLQNLIRETQGKCEEGGRTLCSYFLSLAMQSLEDDTSALDEALKIKLATAEAMRRVSNQKTIM